MYMLHEYPFFPKKKKTSAQNCHLYNNNRQTL